MCHSYKHNEVSIVQQRFRKSVIIITSFIAFLLVHSPSAFAEDFFADEGLEEAVLDHLHINQEDLTQGKLNSITKLDASGYEISTLDGIEQLENVQELDLSHNEIQDVSSLAQLEELDSLYLHNNNITQVFPIRYLTNLSELSLSANQISDVASLSDMNNLKTLRLNSNEIEDLEPIRELKNLEHLYVNDNFLTSLDSVASLTSLKSLWADHNMITSVEPITSLNALTSLHLQANMIEDIDSLSNLHRMQSLWLQQNDIEDLSPLLELSNLAELYVQKNRIALQPGSATMNFLEAIDDEGADVKYSPQKDNQNSEVIEFNDKSFEEAIREKLDKPHAPIYKNDVQHIQTLDLQHYGIREIEAIKHFTNVKELYLSHNQIESLSPLKDLTQLEELYLNNNKIDYLWGLKDLTNLSVLGLSNNEITSLAFLQDMQELERLNLSNNGILDIFTLEKLTKLKELQLSNNQVKNISPLEDLNGLESLWLDDNRVESLEPINGLPRLVALHLNRNGIESLDEIKRLSQLEDLYVQGNEIEELEPIRFFDELINLDISNNRISNLDFIDFSSLNYLYASHNDISSIEQLENCEGCNVDLRYNSLLLNDPNTKEVIEEIGESRVRVTPQNEQQIFSFGHKQNVARDKEWKITFNFRPEGDYKDHIQVINRDGDKIDIQPPRVVGKSILVEPETDYEYGETYTLMVNRGVEFENKDSTLNQPVEMTFTITEEDTHTPDATIADLGGYVLSYNRSSEVILEEDRLDSLNIEDIEDKEVYTIINDTKYIFTSDNNGILRIRDIPKSIRESDIYEATIQVN